MCACVNIKKLTEEFILATRNGLEWQNIQLICFQLPSLWLASSHPHGILDPTLHSLCKKSEQLSNKRFVNW